MQSRDQSPLLHVLNRLQADAALEHAEIAMVSALSDRRVRIPQGQPLDAIVRSRPHFLERGWVAQQRILSAGRRQIIRLFLPGDLIPPGLEDTRGLTNAVLVDATPVMAAAARGEAPGLLQAYRVACRREEVRLVNSVVRLGRMTAYERALDLFEELKGRVRAAGLGTDEISPIPLTQPTLSDILGLSSVHTNRVLQRLRQERAIDFRGGVLRWPASGCVIVPSREPAHSRTGTGDAAWADGDAAPSTFPAQAAPQQELSA